MVNYYSYNSKEEILNAISHWIGFILGITGLVFLILFGVKNRSAA